MCDRNLTVDNTNKLNDDESISTNYSGDFSYIKCELIEYDSLESSNDDIESHHSNITEADDYFNIMKCFDNTTYKIIKLGINGTFFMVHKKVMINQMIMIINHIMSMNKYVLIIIIMI